MRAIHDDSIIPVDRLNVAGADKSTHSVLSTNTENDNYVPIDGIKFKHTWDLPTIININARSLNAEKVDELQVIVDDYDIDARVARVQFATGTGVDTALY